MRPLLVRTALLAVVAPLLVTGPTSAPPAAAERAVPVITVTPVIPAEYPRQVPTVASADTVAITFTVSSSEPVTGATANAMTVGAGLVIRNPSQPLGSLATPATVSFDVAGAEPGVHVLFVTVGAAGAEPGFASIPYVWTTGSPLPAGTTKQYPRSFGWQGTEHVAGLESSTRSVRMLTIVSRTMAYVGLPAFGRPSCTREGNGCVPYAFDPRTALLQVGTGIIAAVHVPGLYTDGLVPADEQEGELFGRHDFAGPSTFSSPRSRPHGTYTYSSPDHPRGLTYEKVTFRKDGTYALAYAVDGGTVKRLQGTFGLGQGGAITFRSRAGRVVQRGTLLVVERTPPRLGPFQKGIWLILSGRKGKHPDGNLLRRIR